jgi:hypothetical protein
VTWAAWADIDSLKFGGTENQARLEEIPAAFLLNSDVGNA